MIPFSFQEKAFYGQRIEEKRIEDSIFKSGSLAAQEGTLIACFNIALIKTEFCRQLRR